MDSSMDFSDDILSSVSDVLEASQEPEKKVPVTCTIEFGLLPEHLADYADQHGNLASAQKADEKDLQTLRSKHHGVARLLAEGVPEGVVAEMCGYTASHISVLKQNPAMIELVNFYRSPKGETAKLIGENLRTVASMSLEIAQRRLETDPDKITITELTGLAKLGFDRSGHGPQSTVHNVSEHRLVASEELIALNKEARRRDAVRIVDPSSVRNILPAPQEIVDATFEDAEEPADKQD